MTVKRVLLEGKRAIGVEVEGRSGNRVIMANQEVILCAGGIGSPQLLEISGIGGKSALSRAGIPVLHSLPGVGENLHTHPAVALTYSCSRPVSILNVTRGLGKLAAGVQWLLTRTGPAATTHFEAGAFVRARPGADRPDCFLIFLPLLLEGASGTSGRHGFQVFVDLYGVRSRGHTHIVSRDVSRQPEFVFNSLKDPADVEALISAIGIIRKIVAQAAFDDLVRDELSPGRDVVDEKRLEEWIRANLGRSHHLAGSCKMASGTDPLAVVGPDLKVHGLDALRVADCSIMPVVPSGNTHAAAIVIGEKAADLIRST